MPRPGPSSSSAARSACSGSGTTVPLPVLGTREPGQTAVTLIPPRKIRTSRNARRRAIVLILVHVAIALHVGFWLLTRDSGRSTLTPIEPSEAMYTLEQGTVNAGFVFFLLAMVSTLIFGRFMCGWACHIVALQDLCSWIMTRMGIHPRPFRSRLLVFVPLLLALYMFVWPTFRREVLQPIAGERWMQLAPYLGVTPPRPELRAHFMTADLWATFPPWYVAIPFLLVCGFGAVYFLGSKGFCTYGCPYGGFFAPIDRLSPGRIVVSDACSGCGHCTAVCTSNIRVHEEVRDFGMVVDSGCMKCLDCVSVCPNDALRFGFARPAILGSRRRDGRKPAQKRFRKRVYDLSWPEELAAAATFFILFSGFRGMFNIIPLLMAGAMAGIGTFLLWKLLCLWREPSVRIQNLQLKFKGRVRPAGLAFGALGVMVLIIGAWSALVKYHLAAASVLDGKITAPMHTVFAPAYSPDAGLKQLAERAAAHLRRAASPAQGGIGWPLALERKTRLAWLYAVAGNDAEAESWLRTAIHAAVRAHGEPSAEQLGALVTLIARRGGAAEEFRAELLAILELEPDLADLRLELARLERDLGNLTHAADQAAIAARSRPRDAAVLKGAADVLLDTGRIARAIELLEQSAALQEGTADAHAQLGLVAVLRNDLDAALAHLVRAYELEPDNPAHARMVARILSSLGREDEATAWVDRANRSGSPSPAAPRR
jgi:polyferredoxin/tetratricopeptide (TPR) repeat protein